MYYNSFPSLLQTFVILIYIGKFPRRKCLFLLEFFLVNLGLHFIEKCAFPRILGEKSAFQLY